MSMLQTPEEFIFIWSQVEQLLRCVNETKEVLHTHR